MKCVKSCMRVIFLCSNTSLHLLNEKLFHPAGRYDATRQTKISRLMYYLFIGSTVIELGWVKCLKRVFSFFPFISIFLIFPFSSLVQYTLFEIQSTARPEICLSDE